MSENAEWLKAQENEQLRGRGQAIADYYHGVRRSEAWLAPCSEAFRDSYRETYDFHVAQLGKPVKERVQ